MKLENCIVLIHGFGGGYFELENLDRFLTEKGLDCRFVQLAGHTGRYKDFMLVTRKQWIRSARKQIEAILEEYETVTIVGFSMGGLIATYMADLPVKSFVFVNTPLRLSDAGKVIGNIFKSFGQYAQKYIRASVRTPLPALYELNELLRETKDTNFGKIKVPCLIIQTRDDDTANSKSGDMISQRLHGEHQIIYYDEGSHKIFNGDQCQQACEDILDFVEFTNYSIDRHTL